jgi:hypothetical protein
MTLDQYGDKEPQWVGDDGSFHDGTGRTVEPLAVLEGDRICRGGSLCQGDGTCEPGHLFCAACLPSVNGRWT